MNAVAVIPSSPFALSPRVFVEKVLGLFLYIDHLKTMILLGHGCVPNWKGWRNVHK